MRLADSLRDWVPRWWRGDGGRAALTADVALWPAEQLFRGAVRTRNRAYDAGLFRADRAPIPVVSVGNLGVGGAGKTPFAAWVAERMAGWGGRPAIVVRGYGRDEMLVHAELNPQIPVFASPVRIEAVRNAAAAGRDVAVLDDGFQHRALARDLDIVLLAADAWDGTLRLLPRGPWREGLGALRRAHVVVVTRKHESTEAALELERLIIAGVGGQQIVRCYLASSGVRPLAGGEGEGIDRFAGMQILVVASLADPRPLVAALEAVGAEVDLAPFQDHHEFSPVEAEMLVRRAGGRPLVMTRKEAVKLRPLLEGDADAWMVEQRVEIESGGAMLDSALRRAMRR